MRCGFFRRMLVAALFLACAASDSRAAKWSATVLQNLCPQGGCARNFSPAALTVDKAGNVFGTDSAGGTHGDGMIYELSFDAVSKTWQFTDIYDFCSQAGCADGMMPYATIIVDTAGNLYGSATKGGNTGNGVIFKLTPQHILQVLYSFCPDGTDCPDGMTPVTPLTYQGAAEGKTYDGVSPLYGTTYRGGTGYGAIFELSPSGGGTYTESVIHAFCSECDAINYDPTSLIMDAQGNLFGTTAIPTGQVYEFATDGNGGWTPSVLYVFCPRAGCYDGIDPRGQLVMDKSGRLYGITDAGGRGGRGTIYSVAPGLKGWIFQVVHDFCADGRCKDGGTPEGGVILSRNGNLIGATSQSGKGLGGVIYELAGRKMRVKHIFCLNTCTDGASMLSNVALDAQGNMFGRTTNLTAGGDGAVFELTP